MTPLLPDNPTRVLAAFHRDQATLDDVLRALNRYEHWLVPAALLEAHCGRNSFPRMVMFGEPFLFPPDELWLFTDRDAAERAHKEGAKLGPIGYPIAGVDLFGSIGPKVATLRVNPVSPAELTWNMPRDSFELAKVWSTAVRFENGLAQLAHGAKPVPIEAIRGYEGFFAFLHPDQQVVTLPNQGPFANPAAIFTAPDCARDFLYRVPESTRSQLKSVYTTGEDLLKKLPFNGVDGIVINPVGPGPTVLIAVTPAVPPPSE